MPQNNRPYRADHVGSLLRPESVKTARADLKAGKISAADLKAVEDAEIKRVIKKQEDVGLQGITDGEFRRSWWHLDFLWGLDGAEKYEMNHGVQFAAMNTRAEGARIISKVGFSNHPMLDHFKFLKDNTTRTPKMTIPSPSAFYGRTGRESVSKEAYPKLEDFFADLGHAYAKALKGFYDAGCRYIQLDEVFLAALCDPKYRAKQIAQGDNPDAIGEIYGDLINQAMSEVPADMTVTMHLCRGNYRSTHMAEGGYEPVAKILFDRIKVRGYFMEYDSERAGGFEPLRHVQKDRRIVLGLITTKTGELESRDTLLRKIEQAAKFAPLDQLCLSPQCGFASDEGGNTLAEEEQWTKLRLCVDVAKEVWGEV